MATERAPRKRSNTNNVLRMPGSDLARQEEIAQRAYEIFQSRGADHGRDFEDWLAGRARGQRATAGDYQPRSLVGLDRPETRRLFQEFMRAALAEARRALAAGEVPIGAVVAIDGSITATGFNQPIGSSDPTAHAEIVALRAAAKVVGNYRLSGAVVCVTLEPCLMCVGAMLHARIGTIVYGAPEPKTGALGSTLDVLKSCGYSDRVAVVPGVLEDECRELVQDFFRQKRGQK